MNLLQRLFAPAVKSHDSPSRSLAALRDDVDSNEWFGVKATSPTRRVGITGRLHYPDTDDDSLITWHRRNELAYACVEKIAQTALDPDLIVEKRTDPKKEWQRDDGHPLRQLWARPSDDLDASAFLARWLVMLHVTGRFQARIYRNDLGLPAQLVPVLPPARLVPVVSGRAGTPPLYYEYQDLAIREDVPTSEVFSDSLFDPADEYGGLPPLAVALGAVDMDAAQTEYVRAFFGNGGVPSGVITVKNKTLSQEESDSILARWMRKYSRNSRQRGAPAVLDQNAEYQKIGANLDELASESLSERAEARVCAPFGVPPLLAGALVGLKNQNNRASAGAANAEFWQNKLSPLYKRIRTHLTWNLLVEFEGRDKIAAGLVRLNWDLSQVAALQEDVTAIEKRAKDSLLAGGITLDEYREKIGKKPLDNELGKVFFIPSSVRVTKQAEIGAVAPPPNTLPAGQQPLQLTEGQGMEAVN
jgi:HK97 family phage portal protein